MSMETASPLTADSHYQVVTHRISPARRSAGRALIFFASLGLVAAVLVQTLYSASFIDFGFENWRPIIYVYVLWSLALGAGLVMTRAEGGERALFLLPALLFTIAMVIFPTFFGLYIAFTDWNLSSLTGRHFSGLDNLRSLFSDPYYWNALGNMIYYVLSVLVQY